MNRTNLNTALWMVIFAAVTFCIIPIFFAGCVFSHFMSDTRLEYVLWVLRFIFIVSPLAAWLLGKRGALPGTKPEAGTEQSRRTISQILTIVVMVIIGLLAVGAWVAFQPLPGRPNIAIVFRGYTNDASGVRLARLALTNLSHATIFAYNPNIEIQSPPEPSDVTNYWPGYNQWQRLQANLAEGGSTNFTIIPPTNPSPWRLLFYVYPDRGRSAKHTLEGVVSISCLSVGVWPLCAKFLPLGGAFRMPYDCESDWIKNEK